MLRLQIENFKYSLTYFMLDILYVMVEVTKTQLFSHWQTFGLLPLTSQTSPVTNLRFVIGDLTAAPDKKHSFLLNLKQIFDLLLVLLRDVKVTSPLKILEDDVRPCYALQIC